MSVVLWIAVIVVGVALAITFVRHQPLEQEAKNWPQVSATVANSYVFCTESSRSGKQWWIPVLGYSYEISGEGYYGSFGLEVWCSDDQIVAAETGQEWRDKKIVVRVNPQRPEKSAFLSEDGAPPSIINYADQPPSTGMIASLFRYPQSQHRPPTQDY
jgi:hypothetical protein